MKVRLAAIPQGVIGTDMTLSEMARLIEQDLKGQKLRLFVSRILRNVPSKNHLVEAKRLYSWIASHVRYQKDPVGIETVQSPLVTLRLGMGDCDDHTALLLGMALAVGIPARFRTVGHEQDNMLHIWTELYAKGRWWPADTTEPQRGFGWRPPKFPVERVYDYKGKVTNMAVLPTYLPVTRGQAQEAFRAETLNVLTKNWRAGLINEADVASYVRVIDEGNFPTDKPLIVDPVRAAIVDFQTWASANLGPSTKPIGTMSGLEGLEGFLGSIWKGVKKVAGTVYSVATGRKPVEAVRGIVTEAAAALPVGLVQAPVTPAAARAGMAELVKSPVVLIGLGLVGFMVLQTMMRPSKKRR